MRTYKDINDIALKDCDIIDLHQTVNGQSLFVVLDVAKLDIRYLHDLSRKYEYDEVSLLEESHLTFDVEWEILCNINKPFPSIDVRNKIMPAILNSSFDCLI